MCIFSTTIDIKDKKLREAKYGNIKVYICYNWRWTNWVENDNNYTMDYVNQNLKLYWY